MVRWSGAGTYGCEVGFGVYEGLGDASPVHAVRHGALGAVAAAACFFFRFVGAAAFTSEPEFGNLLFPPGKEPSSFWLICYEAPGHYGCYDRWEALDQEKHAPRRYGTSLAQPGDQVG